MTLQILRFAEHRRMPWQNGGGTTYEVACAPVGADLAEFDWRISLADVATDGPFSTFPGIDRIIVLINGPWMALTVDGTRHVLDSQHPFAFGGDAMTECTVLSPTRDLNVMTRRGRAEATVEVLEHHPGGGVLRVPSGDPLVIVSLAGTIRVATPTEEVDLDEQDVVCWTGREPLVVAGDGRLAAVHIRTVPPRDPVSDSWGLRMVQAVPTASKTPA